MTQHCALSEFWASSQLPQTFRCQRGWPCLPQLPLGQLQAQSTATKQRRVLWRTRDASPSLFSNGPPLFPGGELGVATLHLKLGEGRPKKPGLMLASVWITPPRWPPACEFLVDTAVARSPTDGPSSSPFKSSRDLIAQMRGSSFGGRRFPPVQACHPTDDPAA